MALPTAQARLADSQVLRDQGHRLTPGDQVQGSTPELRRLGSWHLRTPLRGDPRLRTGVWETGSGSAWDADERYKDVPTTLKNLLDDLDTWLQMYPTMPTLEDPSCPGTTFNHRWDQAQYENFRTKIARYSGWVTKAYDETDKQKSITAWQRVFGDAFKAPAALSAALSLARTDEAPVLLPRAPKEQYIEERGYEMVLSHKAQITAMVLKKDGFRSGPLRRLGSVGKHRRVRFSVTTDVPGPVDVFWKVRNVGPEAAHQLRGEISKDDGSLSRTEPTMYRGRHYVEVYIVKNDRVLAMDQHDVPIS